MFEPIKTTCCSGVGGGEGKSSRLSVFSPIINMFFCFFSADTESTTELFPWIKDDENDLHAFISSLLCWGVGLLSFSEPRGRSPVPRFHPNSQKLTLLCAGSKAFKPFLVTTEERAVLRASKINLRLSWCFSVDGDRPDKSHWVYSALFCTKQTLADLKVVVVGFVRLLAEPKVLLISLKQHIDFFCLFSSMCRIPGTLFSP